MHPFSKITKQIALYEVIILISIITLFWVDEILDLPHVLFGTIATPVNIAESILETIVVIIIGAIALSLTYRFLKHIKYMEGFIYMCSYCKNVKVNDKWIPLDDFLRNFSDAKWSHGLCDDCLQEKYGDLLAKRKHITKPD